MPPAKIRSLLIDDLRLPGDKRKGIPIDAVVARTYREGIDRLKSERWDQLYLDHDLGDFLPGRGEQTGMHVLGWLERNPQHVPEEIHIVTDNASVVRLMRIIANKLVENRATEFLRQNSLALSNMEDEPLQIGLPPKK